MYCNSNWYRCTCDELYILHLSLSFNRETPTLLQSASYIFCFHGLMCGPFCFYKDYIAFIDGTNYTSVKPEKV